MGASGIKREKETVNTYSAICETFLSGVVRLIDAEVAFAAVMHGLTTYRDQKDKCRTENEVLIEVLAQFDSVSIKQFWAAQYVNDVSRLVYTASLFDTFLNESTIFLLLLIPDAIGKMYQVPLQSLIGGQSKNSILTEIAKQKAREISFGSFKDRLSFLRERFGLPIVLSDKTCIAFDHYANLRNSAVHDQGFLALSLNDSGCIEHAVRASPLFPSDIFPSGWIKGERTFRFVALTVARDIFTNILKVEPGSLPGHLELFIEQMLKSPPPEL